MIAPILVAANRQADVFFALLSAVQGRRGAYGERLFNLA
jgi:hypothetical protein